MSYFKAPKQRNIYDYFNQINDIKTKVIPNNISVQQYLAYLQNYLIFRPLFEKNVNLSVVVSNISQSSTDIVVNPGYVLMDYVLIHQVQPVTLTVDKSFVVDNDYVVIVFATYHFNLEEPSDPAVNYQLGLVLFNQNTQALVPQSEYQDQAYDVFINSQNKLYLKFIHLTYYPDDNKYVDDDTIHYLTFSDNAIISTIPDVNNNLILSHGNISWNFDYYD